MYRAKTIALSGEESRDHSTLLQVHVAADLKVAAVASTKKLKTKAVRSYLALCEIQGGGEEEEDQWDNKINRSWKTRKGTCCLVRLDLAGLNYAGLNVS